MEVKGLKPNMQLVIEHLECEPIKLPWDLRTIFDCLLSLEDVDTLQAGSALQVGEAVMHLTKEEIC